MPLVYLLTFAGSDKWYVGISRTNFKERMRAHRKAARKPSKLLVYRAWKKYGEPLVLILGECSLESIGPAEREMIAALNTLHPYGYNMTPGGDGWTGRHTAEAKMRIRAAAIGRKPSDETRRLISANRKGIPSKLKGRKISDEHRAKVAAANQGKKRPQWVKDRMREARLAYIEKQRAS